MTWDQVDVVPAGDRGSTHIADRVVAKIASRAAREALGAFRDSGGRRLASWPSPQASVSVRSTPEGAADGGRRTQGEARVQVAVELAYPSDIGAQCRSVRREVANRVSALAGMEVPEVAVSVERLHSVHSQRAGQERVR